MTPAERIASLEAEVARLRAEAAPAHPSPPLHVVMDSPSDYPEHPIARLALERDDLRRRLMEAVPRWRDGPPPTDTFVWRERDGFCHPVRTSVRHGVVSFMSAHDPGGWQPWGAAHWATIPRPT